METLNKLKSTLHGKSYAEKYDIWMKILQTVDSFESHLKCELYSEFLQEYPFVYDQWNTLAQIYARQKEPHKAFEMYAPFRQIRVGTRPQQARPQALAVLLRLGRGDLSREQRPGPRVARFSTALTTKRSSQSASTSTPAASGTGICASRNSSRT